MRILVIIILLGLSEVGSATTYYVSSSSGNDSNSGTSSSDAWKTVARVNGQALAAGDSVLFKRGDVWNEGLTPMSSGGPENPITFDAYGTGAPPNLTGYYAVPASAWVHVTGNAWKAAVPSTFTAVNFCLFGSVWGQKVAASTSNLTDLWDFYLANGYLYVFSAGSPATFYNDAIVPMALSNVPVINTNGQSWLTFQHFLLNWFDQYGVYVQGGSDHLVFANMESDSMIPQGAQPLGFYVNESAPGPGDIKIYNSSAHLNYDGFRFDGAATAVTMVNDNAYGNRNGALVDNVGAVNYSFCHFYASSLAVANSTDVEWTSGSGPVAGAGNVPADVPPEVQAWQRYPARVTLTVDDIGMKQDADLYYANTVLPIADAAGVPVGVAVTTGYTSTITPIVGEIQGWVDEGRDVAAHSVSHTYYTNTAGLEIQYGGNGTAATLSISGKVFTITVAGAADSVSYNIAKGQPQGTIAGLEQALTATGHFTVSENPTCQGPYGTGCSYYTKAALLSQDLADVSGVDVKSAVYHAQLDVTRLTTDEITLSRQWMTTNLTGLPNTAVYVYPGGYETPSMQAIAAGVPYSGARGALKEDLGTKDTYASGFDVQNITSFGVNPSWQLLPPASLQQKVQALVWKEMVWGVPWGIFWHKDELSAAEITNLIEDLQASGATIQSNSELVNWLTTGTLESGTDGNFYYKSPATSMALDFRPTANSPVVDAGTNLGTAYAIDINGIDQNSYGSGWEIGAHAYIPGATYGQGNAAQGSYFSIGGAAPGNGVQLPQAWVNVSEAIPPGGAYDVTRTASTFAQVQQAICDWVVAPDQWWLVKVPHGTVIETGGTGYTCTQPGSTVVKQITMLTKVVNGAAPAKFLVVDSDTPLPAKQTVCSHGILDSDATRQPPSGDISTWWQGTNWGCRNDIGSMWTLEGNWSPGNTGLLIQAGPWDGATNIGPSHYVFKNAEFRPSPSNAGSVFVVSTDVGSLGTNQSVISQDASHLHFMNIYGHGDAKDWCNGATGITGDPCQTSANTGGPGNNLISTFFKLSSCANCSVTYSYLDYILRSGSEGHDIAIDETPGPVMVAHNWVSGSSIAVFGGGIDSTDPLYSINDLFVWQNRLTNPPSWIGASYNGPAQAFKNRIEFKTGQRVLIDGNIFEWQDTRGAQAGQCLELNPRAGGLNNIHSNNYQVTIEDFTVTNNICRHAATGFTLTGRSGYPANGFAAAQAARRINVSNNLIYDVGNEFFDPGNVVSQMFGVRVTNSGQSYICDGINSSGTITLTCHPGPDGLQQTTIRAGDPILVANCSDPTWNVPTTGSNFLTVKGATALAGTDGVLTVVYSQPTAVSRTATNCLVNDGEGAPYSLTMNHNTLVMDNISNGTGTARFWSGGTANFFTDTGCSGAGPHYNTAITAMNRRGGVVTATVANAVGWPGTFPTNVLGGGVQVIVEVLASGTFTGTFYYLGVAGAGQISWLQPGADEVASTMGSVQQAGTCQLNNFMQNQVWKNNLLAVKTTSAPSCPSTPATGWNGWIAQGGGNQEGCPSGPSASSCSENEVDVANSIVTYTDFPGRCAAKYMEVGGSHAGAIPPVTLTFPASTVCSGATADWSCVGMAGMMNGAVFDANDADYHQYALVPSSQYKSAGDDGADLGVDLGALDRALTRTVYPCGASCAGMVH